MSEKIPPNDAVEQGTVHGGSQIAKDELHHNEPESNPIKKIMIIDEGADYTAYQKGTLNDVVRHINHYVQNIKRDIRFEISDITGKSSIAVVDPETNEVIRQIPHDEVFNTVQKIEELTNGQRNILIKVKA